MRGPRVTVAFAAILFLSIISSSAQASNVSNDGGDDTIIRSFFPVPGGPKQRNQEFLFFNISAVNNDEEMIKTRFHLHRRKMSKIVSHAHDRQLLPPPCRVIIYQVRSLELRPKRLTSLPITPLTPGGWVLLDFTAALKEIHGRAPLVAIRFEGPKGVRLTVNNFLKPVKTKKSKSAPAYLVIFSRSSESDELIAMRERHLKHKEWKADRNLMLNEISVNDLEPMEVRHRSKHKVYEVKRSKEAEMELARRTRLQSLPFLHVNEIADMRRLARKVKRSTQQVEGLTSSAHSEQKHMKKNVHHKLDYQYQLESSQRRGTERVCQRKKVEVSSLLERSEGWILSPSNVGSHVCGGHCHLKSRNGTKGCCRPGKRSPVAMVTADETNALALHKIPGLLVEDCICTLCNPT